MSVLTLCGYILAWYSQKASNWHVFMYTTVSIWMHWSPWTLTRNEAVFITMIFVQSQAIKYGMCCRTLTFDQPLYWKSFKIKQDNHPQFQHLFLRVGGGVLGWMLVVVLFTPIRRESVPSVACCTAWYESTNLQQSSKGSCSLLVSGYNLWADSRWRTLVPPLNNCTNASLASVQALV